mgnify:CR=1 FL=1
MSVAHHGFLALLGIILTTGCGGGDPGKRIVTVYSPHGKEILEVFEARFEAANSVIDVQWLDMGAQDALDRVRSEKANPQGDIWWGAPATNFSQAADENLLAPYRPTWSDQVIDDFKDPQDRWYGTSQLIPVIMFNNQVWHRGAPNTSDRVRFLGGMTYSQRLIAQRFYPFLNYRMPDRVLDGADERLLRLLGKHQKGAYG